MSWNEYVYGPEVRLGGEGDGIEYVRFASFKLQQHQPRISVEQRNCLQYLRRKHEPMHVWEDDDVPYNEAPHKIFGLLSESVDCQMTEDRDRIYALMGMAGVFRSDGKTSIDHTTLHLSVDYRKPLALVFQELAVSIMHKLGAFSILAAIGTFGKHGGLDLPSWTPDFRYQLRFYLIRDYHLRSARPGRKYYPKDEKQLRIFRQANLDYERSILTLQGFRVAQITQEVMSSPPQHEFELAPETHKVIISDKWHLFACRTTAPNQSLEQLSLKLMSASLLDWIDEDFKRAPRGHEHAFPFQATRRYLEYFNAFAVPCEAVEGDILAFVNTVPFPVVLRCLPDDSGRFFFVGCAWLLALQDGLNRGQEDVFREGGIAFHDVYDLEHRKETIQII